jgi:hypothetical protein
MAINVLIVIDGVFQFQDNTAVPDFSFTALVGILQAAGFQVTKANREADPHADFETFNFATSVPSLLDYDVIWMLGDGGYNDTPIFHEGTTSAIGADELNAIAHFMEQGGGVFAVGDHFSLGSDMCGQIPRVRVMRTWYGDGDPDYMPPPELATVPRNFPNEGPLRADTTLINPAGSYPPTDAMHNPTVMPYAYFENQSDALPQTIAPASSPAHPILRNNGHDITKYPDHMHEGNALDVVPGFDYMHQHSPYGDTSKDEFRLVAGNREMPKIIATGQTKHQASYWVSGPTVLDTQLADVITVNTLGVYDGRNAGVGRIVTGSTFHHYIDINLTGASNVTAALDPVVGGDASEGEGLSTTGAIYDDIKQVFINITNWLARPKPVISLILERSTFSQDEVTATPSFPAAIFVTVDGLTPSQFPNGPINTLSPSAATLAQWAPSIDVVDPSHSITATPTAIASDDPTLADRLQRFTFTYRVDIDPAVFMGLGGPTSYPVNASLTTPAGPVPLTDSAWIELVTAANPFMLDLADNNTTYWLSSDIKVFHVVAGTSFLGTHHLPAGANRSDAIAFLENVVSSIDTSQFTNLPSTEAGSVLSVASVTATMPPIPVYNFALARVRVNDITTDTNPVRVFFRTFVSQTTAALTYQLDGSGNPTGGYLQTMGANPIDLPGTQNGGTEWLSFPYFSHTRIAPPSSQIDNDNLQPISAGTGYRIFGALIDNNLNDPYLTATPVSGGPNLSLPTIVMGEHQCVIAQVVYADAPIPSGANPATSDKISQRNLAIQPVSNPGLSASRVAIHTFEMEATPGAISSALPPDEFLLEWSRGIPSGTYLNIHVPTWNAQAVVDLADQFYARHEIRAIDAHTIEIPGGGVRYVPIPQSLQRQTGVISVQLPLGVRKGQRFDLSVQQVTNRQRVVKPPAARREKITMEQAAQLLKGLSSAKHEKHEKKARAAHGVPRGVFDLGNNASLVTDLSVFDSGGDHALIVRHPDPKLVAAARQASAFWRQPIGAFQLGIPVSTKEDMLLYHLQLLSIMTWRVEHLNRRSSWYSTMVYYVELLISKVRALGGDPYTVPPTPDGNIPQLHRHGDKGEDDECDDDGDVVIVNIFPREKDHKR